MLQFDAVKFGDQGAVCGCTTNCCCEAATVRAGSTDKWRINYFKWTTELSANLVNYPEISIEQIPQAAPPSGLQVAGPELRLTAHGTAVTFTASQVSGGTSPYTYSILPVQGPYSGAASVSGANITYTPKPGFVGLDRFFYTVNDGTSNPVIGEVVIRVDSLIPAIPPAAIPTIADATPPIRIRQNGVKIIPGQNAITFPVEVSPAVASGDKFRIIVKAKAADCEDVYTRTNCYDVTVGECR